MFIYGISTDFYTLPGMVANACKFNTLETEGEDCKFKASLDYIDSQKIC